MSKLHPGTKQRITQECENCRRDINPQISGWVCPYCDYDNTPSDFRHMQKRNPRESIHKLSSLYEEGPEGIAFRNAKNLGRKISKAMGATAFANKSNARDTNRGRRKSIGVAYPSGPRINTSPVPRKPRHRKFFGIDKPQTPY
jgi:hypothetical protein